MAFFFTMEHIITALSAQKHNPQRVNVFLDGDFAFGLSRMIAGWLQVGQSLSDDRIAELRQEDQYETAYQQALKYLSYRPRSTAEIRRKLEEHKTPDEIIEIILERLKQLEMVNDDHFAQTWVENRSEFRPRSRRALSYELTQRGIDRETIERSLEAVDEEALAYQAARKHALKLRELEWQTFRQKLFGFLARRGFTYAVISSVVAKVWAETNRDNLDNEEEVFE